MARAGGARESARLGASLRARLDEGEDVLLRHAAAAAGALDLAGVDPVLGRDPRDDRRDEGLAVRRPTGSVVSARPPAVRASPPRPVSAVGGLPAPRRRLPPRRRPRAVAGSGTSPSKPPSALAARSRRASSRPRPSRLPARGSATSDAAPGHGTSVSTLSVEISSSGSSASTFSPLLLEPLGDGALGDGDAHLRHDDVDCVGGRHPSTPPTRAARDVLDLRDEAFSSGGENGTGVSGAVIRITGASRSSNASSAIRPRDLGAEAAGARVFVQHQHLQVFRADQNRVLVPRQHGAQVDDFHRDAVLLELLRRLFGGLDHRAPGDQRDVPAFAGNASLADRNRVRSPAPCP